MLSTDFSQTIFHLNVLPSNNRLKWATGGILTGFTDKEIEFQKIQMTFPDAYDRVQIQTQTF